MKPNITLTAGEITENITMIARESEKQRMQQGLDVAWPTGTIDVNVSYIPQVTFQVAYHKFSNKGTPSVFRCLKVQLKSLPMVYDREALLYRWKAHDLYFSNLSVRPAPSLENLLYLQ